MFGKLHGTFQRKLDRSKAKRAIRKGLFEGVDWDGMAALRKKFDGHWAAEKYYDGREGFLVRNAARVFTLGLDQAKGKRLLDLGCGFGYFLYAAKQFGHEVVGLDLPDDYFSEVTDLLGLTKVVHQIERMQALPEIPNGPFDIVTAFETGFDRPIAPDHWGVEEWKFFLNDLKRFMSPDCLLYIKFNDYWAVKPRMLPEDLEEFFRSLGGRFEKRAMSLPDAVKAIERMAAS